MNAYLSLSYSFQHGVFYFGGGDCFVLFWFFTPFVLIAQLFSGFFLEGIAPCIATDSVCQLGEG